MAGGVLAAVLFLPGISTRALWRPDETRYAEIAREMLARGDWIVPHFDSVPYLDKPPLLYWLTAAAYAVGGVNEAAARVVPLLSALVTLFFTYLLGARLGTRATGVRAAAICATSLLFLAAARLVLTDMLLTACTTATIAAGAIGCEALAAPDGAGGGGDRGRRWLLLAGVAAGLGLLVKGPVGVVVPGLALGTALLGRGARCRPPARALAAPLAACLLVALPWYVAVQVRRPDFISHFFIGQNVEGFLGYQRVHHPGGWHTYFVYLPAIWFPWSLFLPAAAVSAGRALRAGDERVRLPAAWAVAVFLFFCLCDAKLPTYLLPLYPALALLTARLFEPAEEAAVRRGVCGRRGLALATAGIALAGLAVPVAAASVSMAGSHLRPSDVYGLEPAARALGPYVALACGGGAALAMVALYRRRTSAVWAVVALVAALLALGVQGAPLVEASFSPRALAARLAPRLGPADVVAVYEGADNGLDFYLRRPILLVGKPGELDIRTGEADPAARNDPGRVFRTRPEFDALCRSRTRVYCLVKTRDLDAFHALVPAPLHEVDRSGERILLVNDPH